MLGSAANLRLLSCSTFLLCLTLAPGTALAAVLSINPTQAYLHLKPNDNAPDAVAIELIALNLQAGDIVELTQLGDFDGDIPPGTGIDNQTSLSGVFSASAVLLPKAALNRVQDAIDAGDDVFHGPTCADIPDEPQDIPEDFLIGGPGATQAGPLEIEIPDGATHLFIAVPDCLSVDNSDPDGDMAVRIVKLNQTPALGAGSLTVLVGLIGLVGALGVRRRARRKR